MREQSVFIPLGGVKKGVGALIVTSMVIVPWLWWQTPPQVDPATRVIVQGEDPTAVAALVRGVGGEVTRELGIIDASPLISSMPKASTAAG